MHTFHRSRHDASTSARAAEVYPALGGVDRGSISERGGRYAPEFLWNTNWKDQLELEQVRLLPITALRTAFSHRAGLVCQHDCAGITALPDCCRDARAIMLADMVARPRKLRTFCFCCVAVPFVQFPPTKQVK